VSAPRQYGCPLVQTDCQWVYETPTMPDGFKAEPYELKLRLGGTLTTTLSENVRESMWAAEHRAEVVSATADHLVACHTMLEMVTELAPQDYEAGWDDRCC
jgi:hypothetical protein